MNRRLTGTLGLAAAAVIGSTVPAWAYWTLTSDPSSVAAAKATQLNAANVEAGRNGKSGVNAKIVIRIGAGPGAIPDRYTVYRGPDLLCLDRPANLTCEETGSNNSGDKIYTITAYAGTNWVSAVSTCSFKNNDALPDVPSSMRCAPIVGVTSLSSSADSFSASNDSDSKQSDSSKSGSVSTPVSPSDPAPAAPEPTGTGPEPTPAPDKPDPEATVPGGTIEEEPTPAATPEAPSAPRLVAADDSGTSDSDGITNDPTPRVEGTAAPGAAVLVRDGSAELGRTTAGADGSYRLEVELGEGSYDLSALALNDAGASASSGSTEVRIDLTAPEPTVAATGEDADGQITGTLGTAPGDADTVRLEVDNDADVGTVEVGGKEFTAGIQLAVGTTTIVVTQSDTAGNVGTARTTVVRPKSETATQPTGSEPESATSGGEPAATDDPVARPKES